MTLISRLLNHILQSWVAQISSALTIISFLIGATGTNFLLPTWMYWLIGGFALVFGVVHFLFKLHNENIALSNPTVDFAIHIHDDDVGLINEKFFTEGINDIGAIEFSAHLDVRNKRNEPTIIQFEMVSIETDLPVVKTKYPLEVHGQRRSRHEGVLELNASEWDKAVYLKSNIEFQFHPVEEKLPQIGKSTYLHIKVRATQSDKGFSEFVIKVPNPFERIEGIFVERIIQRLRGNLRETSPQQLVNYLKLIWKG
jgi:hypothetical protein